MSFDPSRAATFIADSDIQSQVMRLHHTAQIILSRSDSGDDAPRAVFPFVISILERLRD